MLVRMAVNPPVASALYTPGKGSMLPTRTLKSVEEISLSRQNKPLYVSVSGFASGCGNTFCARKFD